MSNRNFLHIKDQPVNYVSKSQETAAAAAAQYNLYSIHQRLNCHRNHHSHPRRLTKLEEMVKLFVKMENSNL